MTNFDFRMQNVLFHFVNLDLEDKDYSFDAVPSPLRCAINLSGVPVVSSTLLYSLYLQGPTAKLDIQRRIQLRVTISLNLVNSSSHHFMCSLLNQFFSRKLDLTLHHFSEPVVKVISKFFLDCAMDSPQDFAPVVQTQFLPL